MLASCADQKQEEPLNDVPGNKKLEILQSWQGDYPLNQLDLLPQGQRDKAVGYISDRETFSGIWHRFKPGADIPEIDFKINLVLFARNTQFYNRISIGQVNFTAGVAEVLAMETMSALPIEDKVAFSLAVVPRQGITAIKIGEKQIAIN
jgi:hypothetical protein